MPNEAEVFGLPQVIINFRTKGTTAIKRSARGIVAMILHDNSAGDGIGTYKVQDVSDVPASLSAANQDLIKKCLLGTPLRVLVYTIAGSSTGSTNEDNESGPYVSGNAKNQNDVLKVLSSIKWNWICAPTATSQEQNDLVSWVKTQRDNKRKTFKAVVAHQAADHEGIVNFCTDNIRVQNDTDVQGNPIYTTYTATQYTARIAGILAGLSLDRSATYYKLTEVEDVEVYEDIDSLIDSGELLLIDEQDGDGVKIARACNSLTSFTTDKGEDFRKIKIIEGIDMITDDIRDTFKKYYVGKVINDYNHKMLFISAVLIYFGEIQGNVLDADADNTVDIDEEWQADYAKLHGDEPSEMTEQQIREYNTGDKVVLAGDVRFVDAMENLTINFTM